MINEPTVDEMTRKLGSQEDPASAYVLCVVAAKRARQIAEQEQSASLYAGDDGEKEIVKACKEIAEGKIGYTKD